MKRFIPWLTAVVLVSGIFLSMAGLVHQSLRGSANDPQIQMAEDTAAALQVAAQPQAVQQVQGTVTLGATLDPFVIIYDQTGKPVAGSGYLDGQLARVPIGVLQAAAGHPYHTVTWQPTATIRIAAVTVKAGSYYVLAGRSLQEVEKREQKTMQTAAVGWLAAMVVLAAAYGYMYLLPKSKR
ncbi:MAG TPA: hypothetical protein VLF91_03355 [Candidatus Saccharimonadales bacterium]|nr:hypothetical protein [Candidatus Saccharimonadales bacterium]